MIKVSVIPCFSWQIKMLRNLTWWNFYEWKLTGSANQTVGRDRLKWALSDQPVSVSQIDDSSCSTFWLTISLCIQQPNRFSVVLYGSTEIRRLVQLIITYRKNSIEKLFSFKIERKCGFILLLIRNCLRCRSNYKM